MKSMACVRTKIFIAERLSLFVRVLALPQRVVFHHFSPLLHASRPSLLHAFMVVNALFAKEVTGRWGHRMDWRHDLGWMDDKKPR